MEIVLPERGLFQPFGILGRDEEDVGLVEDLPFGDVARGEDATSLAGDVADLERGLESGRGGGHGRD